MTQTDSRRNQNQTKLFWFAGGLLVLFLTGVYLYQSLSRPGMHSSWLRLKAVLLGSEGLCSLVPVLFLMLVNWAVETCKWHILLRQVQYLNVQNLVKSLLAGLSLALFTPARLGEYGGRVIYLKPENRVKGTLAMMVGSLSQMLVTVLGSMAALIYFVPKYLPESTGGKVFLPLFCGITTLVLVFAFFNIASLERGLRFLPFVKRFSHYFSVTSSYSTGQLMLVFSLSLLRYLIFTGQYFLLLAVFGLHPALIDFMSAMAIVFVIQSLVPAFALADLGIRGAASGFFLGLVCGPLAAPMILATTFGIWLINIILPALCGLFFIVKLPTSIDNSR